MAAPAVPTNFLVQSGNGVTFLSWDQMATATSYVIKRSLDNITFSTLATVSGSPLNNFYTDTPATLDLTYWYEVQAVNADGSSSFCTAASTVPEASGKMSLAELRLEAQQRCDQEGGVFITKTEWNRYISRSYKELYDILIQKFGDDYFVTTPYSYTTAADTYLYALPVDFYKLLGAEISIGGSYVSLRKFEFIQRNMWNQPNVYTMYGLTNLRYRLSGSNLRLTPTPAANQTVRIWYAPRPSILMADTDTVDGVSGWEEYIIVDTCIKAMAKEESDPSVFIAQKNALIKRIEEAAENRDIGEPEVVSDSKMRNSSWAGDDWSGSGGGISGW